MDEPNNIVDNFLFYAQSERKEGEERLLRNLKGLVEYA